MSAPQDTRGTSSIFCFKKTRFTNSAARRRQDCLLSITQKRPQSLHL